MEARRHSEYFEPVAGRKCPCGNRHSSQVWAWGEYDGDTWHTVTHFCQGCYPDRVRRWLLTHQAGCGCAIELRPRCGYGVLPAWLAMPAEALERTAA